MPRYANRCRWSSPIALILDIFAMPPMIQTLLRDLQHVVQSQDAMDCDYRSKPRTDGYMLTWSTQRATLGWDNLLEKWFMAALLSTP